LRAQPVDAQEPYSVTLIEDLIRPDFDNAG